MSSRLTVSGSAIWPIAYLAAPVPYRGCSLGGIGSGGIGSRGIGSG